MYYSTAEAVRMFTEYSVYLKSISHFYVVPVKKFNSVEINCGCVPHSVR